MSGRVSFATVRLPDGNVYMAYPVTGRIGKDGRVLYQIYMSNRRVRRKPSEMEPAA